MTKTILISNIYVHRNDMILIRILFRWFLCARLCQIDSIMSDMKIHGVCPLQFAVI